MAVSPTTGFELASQGTNLAENNNTNPPKAKSYRYPLRRIESKSDYLEIRIIEYKPPGFGETQSIDLKDEQGNLQKGELTGNTSVQLTTLKTGTEANRNQKPLKYIYLPIPQNLSDTNSITWGDDTLNPLEAFGLKNATAIAKQPLEGGQKAVKDFYTAVMGGSDLIKKNKDLIAATVGGALVNAVGGSVSIQSVIARASGQVLNPNLELLFQGVNLRSFPFVFDFAPRDEREAREVKEIIRAFKYHMSPKDKATGALGKVFISSPDVFLVRYMNGNRPHPFLNKFKPMALTDMQLTYTGSGTYATYQDGTPVHMQMSLTFKELNPIYSSDYDDLKIQGDTSVGY